MSAGTAGPGNEISAQRFAVANGRPIGTPQLITQRDVLVTPILMHDGRRVITTMPGRTEIRDATSWRLLERWSVGARSAAVSPNDRTLLLGGSDGSVRFLKAEIDIRVFAGLVTRAGGEVPASDY